MFSRYFSILGFVASGVGLMFNSITAQYADFTLDDFILTGDAVTTGDQCFQLTEDMYWQGGAAWFKKATDLNESFRMELELSFGCRDLLGADGIVFIFHPSLTTGSLGEGMGFGRLSPAFGIEMDTYQNFHLDDPSYDHVALMTHGIMSHQLGLTEPVQIAQGKRNIEDCINHKVTINWDPELQFVRFYFDGILRVEKQIDLVNEVFGGNPVVYWGFTAATGDKTNRHLVCIRKLEFTENFSLRPVDRQLLLDGEKYTLKNLKFPSGSNTLPGDVLPELDKLIQFFHEHPKHSIIIHGYTDSSGEASQNERLSRSRAKAVAEYIRQNGIPAHRIVFRGLGEKDPIESNATEAGRLKNRRVEVAMKILKV